MRPRVLLASRAIVRSQARTAGPARRPGRPEAARLTVGAIMPHLSVGGPLPGWHDAVAKLRAAAAAIP